MDLPTLSVLELTTAVRRLVADAVPDEVWVQGEIASLRRTAAGHVFFDLVEPGPPGRPPAAVIGVVLFDAARRAVNATLRETGAVRMTDGVQIRLRGRIDLWPGSGRLQVRMSDVDPAYTLGRLAADRDELLRRLAAEDLLAANGRRPLPDLPLHVGLVTRVGSAAHADVLHELAGAGIGFRIRVVDVGVQGRDAAAEVAAAVRSLDRLGVDAVLLARGGGARTDLAAFDAEVVARAIATSRVPVLTGIGHEVDTTVADAVAHTACKTPTAVAAHLVARAQVAVARLDQVAHAVGVAAPAALERSAHRVAAATARLDRAAGAHLLRAELGLDGRAERVARAAPRALAAADRRLAALGARTAALDPARALARGWSLTRRADGTLVRHPEDVGPGDLLVTTTAGGEVRSRVTATVDPSTGGEAP